MVSEGENIRRLTAKEFGRIFNKCRPIFLRIAISYIHDEKAAEDIVDDCFIKTWEKRDEIITDNFEAYSFKAVINRCLDYLKVQQSRIRIQQDIHATGNRLQMYEISSLQGMNPDKLFESEMIDLVKECLKNMPEDTRRIFIASRLENKTYNEISVETGTSVRQVTSHIQKALKYMRSYLKDYLPAVLAAFVNCLHF